MSNAIALTADQAATLALILQMHHNDPHCVQVEWVAACFRITDDEASQMILQYREDCEDGEPVEMEDQWLDSYWESRMGCDE